MRKWTPKALVAVAAVTAILSATTGMQKCEADEELVPDLVPYANECTLLGNIRFDDATLKRMKESGIVTKTSTQAQPHHPSHVLELFRGRLLIAPQNAITINVTDATIRLAPHTVAYIYATGTSTSILNLHDTHRHAVIAEFIDGSSIDLPPGRELLITRWTDLSFDDARLFPGVWYRTVYDMRPAPGVRVFLTQSSTLSAACIFPAVKKLVATNPYYRQTLMKTFAAVIQVSHDPTPFRPKMESSTDEATAAKAEPSTEPEVRLEVSATYSLTNRQR